MIDRRRLLVAGGAALATSGVSAVAGSVAAETASAVDLMGLVHPELRPAVQQFQAMDQGQPPLSQSTLATQRAGMKRFYQEPLLDVAVTERVLPPVRGQPPVRVFVINANGSGRRPAILHTHGGGFVLGDAAGSVRPMQQLARELDCVIVTVEYRLAPEARWRESVADNYVALRWLQASAAELGVDAKRIALLGESAGGGHAALLAIAARDGGEVPLVAQILIYPMLDDRTGSSRVVAPHLGAIGWNAASNRFGWQSFLGMVPGTGRVPAAAVPARTRSLRGLAPAFIGVGSIDLFVEEDLEYARRLIDAGVSTEVVVVPGAFHGFDMGAPDAAVSRQFRASWVQALRRAFGAA